MARATVNADAIDAVRTPGGAWVVWREATPESSAIRARHTDEHGLPDGPEWSLATGARGHECGAPRASGDGERVRCVFEVTEGNTSDLWLRTLDPAQGLGAAQSLAAAAPYRLPRGPQVAVLAASPSHPPVMAVTWTDWSGDVPALAGVWCDSLGVPLGEPALWWSPPGGARAPAVAAWGRDSVVLAWVEGEWPARIRFCVAQAGETTIRTAFDLSDPGIATRRAAPSIAARDGRGLCVWSEAAAGRTRVGARWLTEAGALGTPFAVEVNDGQHALSPRVALAADGHALCAWEEGAGDSSAIRGIGMASEGSPTSSAEDFCRAAHGCRTVAVLSREATGSWLGVWGASRDSADAFVPEAAALCPDSQEVTAAASERTPPLRRDRSWEIVYRQATGRPYVRWSGLRPVTLRAVDAAGRYVGHPVDLPAGSAEACEVPLSAFAVPPRCAVYLCPSGPGGRMAAGQSGNTPSSSSVARE